MTAKRKRPSRRRRGLPPGPAQRLAGAKPTRAERRAAPPREWDGLDYRLLGAAVGVIAFVIAVLIGRPF